MAWIWPAGCILPSSALAKFLLVITLDQCFPTAGPQTGARLQTTTRPRHTARPCPCHVDTCCPYQFRCWSARQQAALTTVGCRWRFPRAEPCWHPAPHPLPSHQHTWKEVHGAGILMVECAAVSRELLFVGSGGRSHSRLCTGWQGLGDRVVVWWSFACVRGIVPHHSQLQARNAA